MLFYIRYFEVGKDVNITKKGLSGWIYISVYVIFNGELANATKNLFMLGFNFIHNLQ